MVFPTFFNLSLNLAIRSSRSEPQSAPGLVFADCIELLHLWLQRYNQSDFRVDHLVMSICKSSLVLLEEGVCYDQCILLEELYLPLPCFILYSKACYFRYFLTSYLCIPVPYDEKDIIFRFSSRKSCRSS